MSRRTSGRSRRAAGALSPQERPAIDLGWKSRSVCVDGPARFIALGRHVEPGERISFRQTVDGAIRVVVYESIGECDEVPRADGVGLKFVGFENDPQTKEGKHGS